MKITLKDASNSIIATVENGNQSSYLSIHSADGWIEKTVTFTNTAGYGNIRYIEVESGGKDLGIWGGHYGINFDDAVLSINGM